MKRGFALLDLLSTKQEEEQHIRECLWKMKYRNIEYMFITEHRTPELQKWTQDLHINFNVLIKDDCFGLLARLFNKVPSTPAWKLGMIRNDLATMDDDRQRFYDKIIFFDADENTRRKARDLNDARLLVCGSLQEAADGMDLPKEAFTESEEALRKLRVEIGLDRPEE